MMDEFPKLILCFVFISSIISFTVVGSLWLLLF